MKQRGFERKRSWPSQGDIMVSPEIIKENNAQSQCASQDSNQTHPEYKVLRSASISAVRGQR
jgi:hypothetical protein